VNRSGPHYLKIPWMLNFRESKEALHSSVFCLFYVRGLKTLQEAVNLFHTDSRKRKVKSSFGWLLKKGYIGINNNSVVVKKVLNTWYVKRCTAHVNERHVFIGRLSFATTRLDRRIKVGEGSRAMVISQSRCGQTVDGIRFMVCP
jgi:hypothetical protein